MNLRIQNQALKNKLEEQEEKAFRNFLAAFDALKSDDSDAETGEPHPLEEIFRGPALDKSVVIKKFAEYQRGKNEVESRKQED